MANVTRWLAGIALCLFGIWVVSQIMVRYANAERPGTLAVADTSGASSEPAVKVRPGTRATDSGSALAMELSFEEALQELYEQKIVRDSELGALVTDFLKQMEYLRRKEVLQPWSREIVISRLLDDPSLEYERISELVQEGDIAKLQEYAENLRALGNQKYVALVLELQCAVLDKNMGQVYTVAMDVAEMMEHLRYPHLRELFTTLLTEFQTRAEPTLEMEASYLEASFSVYSRYVSRALIAAANDGLL